MQNVVNIASETDELSNALHGRSGFKRSNHTMCKWNVNPDSICLKFFLGFLDLVSTMQQLNKKDSYALLQEGLSEGAQALMASAVNVAVDSVTAFKDAKVSTLFGTDHPLDLSMTQLALTITWR